MNSRFPILTAMALLLRLLGALLALAGIGLGFYFGFVEPSQPGHRFGSENLTMIAAAVLGLMVGIFAFVTGEVVGVLFAIEKNTRRAPVGSVTG